MSAIIGSGFYAAATDLLRATCFADLWIHRLAGRDVVILNNAEFDLPLFQHPSIREIRVKHNLGHVAHWLGKPHTQLLGWSMSWILPALVAYSEQRDFIYIEQDCLVFGNWESTMIAECQSKNLAAGFGYCDPSLAACEQSLFWIARDFIPEFVSAYMAIPEGDATILPEEKFMRLKAQNSKVGQFSMPFGRLRPLDLSLPAFYAQKLTQDELAALKGLGMI